MKKLILIYGCAYSVVLPCLKIAILLDWCDIFVVHARRESAFWWGCMFVSAIQAIWGVLCVILLNTQCVPYQAIWDFYLESKCYKASDVMLTSASVQVVSDVCMVLLPQKVIWGLNMNVQKKLGVAVMFGVGLLYVHLIPTSTCLVSCRRFIYTYRPSRLPLACRSLIERC